MFLGASSLFTYELYAQDNNRAAKREQNRKNSLQRVDQKLQDQQRLDDKNTMDDAKNASFQSKAKAKEAQRIEKDANNASIQSKRALKMEKNAQKARRGR